MIAREALPPRSSTTEKLYQLRSYEREPQRAAARAVQAIRYLAQHYPECAGRPLLDPHRDAVHGAAVDEDMAGYEEALRRRL
jgi:hypothetical protein